MLTNHNTKRWAILAAGWMLLLGASAWAEQAHYPGPEQAVQALLEAAAMQDSAALKGVFGPQAKDLSAGDPLADAAERSRFLAQAALANRVELQGEAQAVLLVGPEDWPFSVPLVRDEAGWRFDTPAGIEELTNRRIGSNELHAIASARAYVEAQYEYADRDPMGAGQRQYAQRFRSSEGQRDGLFWPVVEDEAESPLGPLVVQAGYGEGEKGAPYHGYYYRILKAQGANAAGGARSYLSDGAMSGGFGLVAYPAEHGRSGIMTFIVDHRGLMFQRDLGADTASLAGALTEYDPGPGWMPVIVD